MAKRKRKPKLVSTREAAAQLELTRMALSRYAAEGCPHVEDSELGRGRFWDVEAVRAWQRSLRRTGRKGQPSGPAPVEPPKATTPPRPRGKAKAKGKRKAEPKAGDALELELAQADAELAQVGEHEKVPKDPHDAKKYWDALISKTKALQLQGALLDANEVKSKSIRQIRAVRNGLLTMAPKIAPRLAHKTAKEIEAEITDAMHELLEEFAKGTFE